MKANRVHVVPTFLRQTTKYNSICHGRSNSVNATVINHDKRACCQGKKRQRETACNFYATANKQQQKSIKDRTHHAHNRLCNIIKGTDVYLSVRKAKRTRNSITENGDSMNPRNKKRQVPPPALAAAVVALISAGSVGRMSSIAFGTAPALAPARPRPGVTAFAVRDDAPAEEGRSTTTAPLVTDANYRSLLRPPSGRPVLVDAYSPRCGPCARLDQILRRARPRYAGAVDFVKWNVEDREDTAAVRRLAEDGGHAVRALPTLLVFRDGRPVASRTGFANEFQLDYFLEGALPDVLEKTFDEDGIKMVPLTQPVALVPAVTQCDYVEEKMVVSPECGDDQEEEEEKEHSVWQNRTSVPAMEGISSLPGQSLTNR